MIVLVLVQIFEALRSHLQWGIQNNVIKCEIDSDWENLIIETHFVLLVK